MYFPYTKQSKANTATYFCHWSKNMSLVFASLKYGPQEGTFRTIPTWELPISQTSNDLHHDVNYSAAAPFSCSKKSSIRRKARFVAMAKLISRPKSSFNLRVKVLSFVPQATHIVPTGTPSFSPATGPAYPVTATV